jgi:hypothetical protein
MTTRTSIISERKVWFQLGMRSNQFKQSRSWKIEKNWTRWKFWNKKKSLIFSLWAHQMKIIEDHIVFIKIFCCGKLKNYFLSSLSKSNFQTFKPFQQFECLNGLKLVWSHPFQHARVWFIHAECDLYTKSGISTRRVWFIHGECKFYMQCDVETHKCDYDTYDCDFNSTRTRVISTTTFLLK